MRCRVRVERTLMVDGRSSRVRVGQTLVCCSRVRVGRTVMMRRSRVRVGRTLIRRIQVRVERTLVVGWRTL